MAGTRARRGRLSVAVYTPIVATLGYVLSPDRSRVLLVHRNARPGDQHLGKYNGLGGKLERDEDVLAGMRREIREEAGIECVSMRLRGTVNWPGFGKHGEDWLGFVFVVDAFEGTPFASNPGHAGVDRARSHARTADVGRRPPLPAAGVRRRSAPVPR